MAITTTSGKLTGTIQVGSAGCIDAGTVSGTLSGQAISFGAVKGDATISYDGQLSADGQSMQGTYSAGESCKNDKGTWTAQHGG